MTSNLGRKLRNIAGALIGNFLDWTDFVIYAQFTVIISTVMFPKTLSPEVAVLNTLLVFGIGFIFRPIGSIVFGHLGDKYGRKNAMLITFWIMGIATMLTGLIPSYSSLGILAPVFLTLVRIAQGFAAGGELGGALSYLIESATPKRRCFYGSWVGVTILGASMLATGTAYIITSFGKDFAYGIGWRIPFVLYGLILIPVAAVLRYKMEDSPLFKEIKERKEIEKVPVAKVFTKELKPAILAIMTTFVGTVVLYAITSFWPTYLSQSLKLPLGSALLITLVAEAVILILTPVWAYLSDTKLGRKLPSLIASIFFALFTYPLFLFITSYSFEIILLITVVLAFFMSILEATLPVWIGESFATNERYSGYIAYSIAISYFGGFTPYISQFLILSLHTALAPVIYIVISAIVSAIGFALMKETYKIEVLPATKSIYQESE
ncbi:MAG: MFS transporter [Thermoproteota archaeon]|jgi:Arabinose efflux permease